MSKTILEQWRSQDDRVAWAHYRHVTKEAGFRPLLYDMLHPLFCHQVGRAPGTVGRACALPGPTVPTLATPLYWSPC